MVFGGGPGSCKRYPGIPAAVARTEPLLLFAILLSVAAAAALETCDEPLSTPEGSSVLDWLSLLWPGAQQFVPTAVVEGVSEEVPLESDGGSVQHGDKPVAKTTTSLSSTLAIMILPALLSSMLRGADSKAYEYALYATMKLRSLVHGEEYQRCITHQQRFDRWGYECSDRGTADDRNSILQKALTLHIAALEENLDFDTARISLTKRVESTSGDGEDDNDDGDSEGDGSVASQLKKFTVSTIPPQDEWVVVQRSPHLEFRCVTENVSSGGGNNNGGGGGKMTTVTTNFWLRSRARNADGVVGQFIHEAFSKYTSRMKEDEAKFRGRYMYTPLSKSDGHWKRYKLSDEKSFNTLFFPQKSQLLRLLGNFSEKAGKFAIPGYPHKLGLLLHGPPGTGKTSLIKALAQHTGRSIVSIPLSRIKTNQQLMDCVFDQCYSVPGQGDGKIKLDFSQSIFVMEDVDAASAVVQKRAGGDSGADGELRDSLKRNASTVAADEAATSAPGGLVGAASDGEKEKETGLETEQQQPPVAVDLCLMRQGSAATRAVNDNSASSVNLADGEGKEDDDVTAPSLDRDGTHFGSSTEDAAIATVAEGAVSAEKRGAGEIPEGEPNAVADNTAAVDDNTAAAMVATAAKTATSDDEPAASDAARTETEGTAPKAGKEDELKEKDGRATGASQGSKDKLDLAGLLNVLDGVVDCPNRIVVMTSNHPEKLDPALIRPGRVNLKLYLGYIELPEARDMVEHYFGGWQGRHLTNAQYDELTRVWNKSSEKVQLTPAQLEQLCAEHDAPEELFAALERLSAELVTAN